MAGFGKDAQQFDLTLALECAKAYAGSTGLGCTVSGAEGTILGEFGYGCAACEMCRAAGISPGDCAQSHIYGMTEAERFGGKYIYFCPMGLTCFVSPIMGQAGSAAKITVGPFLMVEPDDYVAFDLKDQLCLPPSRLERALLVLERIPRVSPEKVNALSALLFMAVSFMNDVSAASRMLDAQNAYDEMGNISAYIFELKREGPPAGYPLEIERALLKSVSGMDKARAHALSNELLGRILFFSGDNFGRIKTRLHELLVLVSRNVIDAGAPPEQTLLLSERFAERMQTIRNIDELCLLAADALHRYIDSVSDFSDIKHLDMIHKAVQYVRENYAKKITLEDVSRAVSLSPSYFSRVFKEEMGCNFNAYLNRVRIDNSKRLLLTDMRLADVAMLAGYEDQSYFTKVFKRVTGTSPNRYRELGGRR